jgi:signal transduction histidine kinase
MQDSVIGKKLAQLMPENLSDLAALGQQTDALTDKHADWLEAEGIRAFMAGQKATLYVNLVAIPLLFGIMYEHVNMLGLGLWAVAAAALLAYRFWLTNSFEKLSSVWGIEDFLCFRRQHAWTWPAAAVMWGMLTCLFYAKSPLLVQFIAWVSLVCVGVFGATGYVGHLKTLKNFINALICVCLIVMFWTSYTSTDPEAKMMTLKLTPLILVFWMMLIVQGKRLNEAFRQRMVLRKGNIELIDSLKAQTERAVNAIDMKNRLLASAAHDIRQPVLALDLYANMLRSDPDMAPLLTPKITVATRSVIEMFDSLFDLSRLETGQIQIDKSSIDVATFMDELFLQYQPAAQLKGLELRIHSCQASIVSDPQLLKRAIGNLIANAIKFTDKNGVLLACRKTQNAVRFEVWDTGMGIAPEQQQAVFQEFYKAPLIANAPIGMNEGFGLGLSIVARFCESLGHTFSMRSTLGKGSVFRITVPITEVASPADARKK